MRFPVLIFAPILAIFLSVFLAAAALPSRGDADATRNDLDHALGAAARKVTRWP